MSNKCSKCGGSIVDEKSESVDVRVLPYREQPTFSVELAHSVCLECGSVFVTKEQLQRNDDIVKEKRDQFLN